MPDASRMLRIACIQNSAGDNPEKNLKKIRILVNEALKSSPHVVALPENFYLRGGDKKALCAVARTVTRQVLQEFCEIAKGTHTSFLLGSIVEPSPIHNKCYNTSVLISAAGKITARYRKIHLFDVTLATGVSIRESRGTVSGSRVVTANMGAKKAGLAICYDLRFPELFRQLTVRGARMIFLPANFTRLTGQAHWEILVRARAIENQVFMIAPAQTGVHPVTGIASYGRSLIVDPWGNVLAQGSLNREEVITAVLDFKKQDRLRRDFPVLRHIRLLTR